MHDVGMQDVLGNDPFLAIPAAKEVNVNHLQGPSTSGPTWNLSMDVPKTVPFRMGRWRLLARCTY